MGYDSAVSGEGSVGAANNEGCRGKHDGYVTVWDSRKEYLFRDTASILTNIQYYSAQANLFYE